MIDIDDAEKALNYLKRTDEEAARARSLMNYLDDSKKTILAVEYGKLTEGSAADRLKKAEGSIEYIDHLSKIRDAMLDYEKLRNQRKSAELQIEMWRSCSANMRKGNI